MARPVPKDSGQSGAWKSLVLHGNFAIWTKLGRDQWEYRVTAVGDARLLDPRLLVVSRVHGL